MCYSLRTHYEHHRTRIERPNYPYRLLFRNTDRYGYVEEADFVYIRQETGATAGNLSVQIDKLSKAGYVSVTKTFKGKMPCTLCKITPQGLDAFEEYVEALKSYIVK